MFEKRISPHEHTVMFVIRCGALTQQAPRVALLDHYTIL